MTRAAVAQRGGFSGAPLLAVVVVEAAYAPPVRRSTLLVLIGSLLLAVSAPAAGDASPPAGPSADSSEVAVEFELAAGHGLRAQLETFGDEIALAIYGHHQYVVYTVKGEISPSGVVAKFGALGEIAVTFMPTKTISSQEPPKGCQGDPQTDREGTFSGTIKLSGEREYVRLDATEAKGEMQVLPRWRCGSRQGRNDGPPPPTVAHRAATERDVATLKASSRSSRSGFGAAATRGPKGRGSTIFSAGVQEQGEAMKIARFAILTAAPSTFLFDHAKGTATVRPPRPFSGSASFERRRGGSPTWTGSLKVRLLGADPLALTGPGFRAHLKKAFPGGE